MPTPDLTVRDVMDPRPVAVAPDCAVQDALRIMNERRIGSVLVTVGDTLAGIFTERDLLRRVVAFVQGWRELPVSAWMTVDPYVVAPGVGWDDAVGLMERLRVRHLPVIDGGKVLGIVSSRMLMAGRAAYLNRRVEERTAQLRAANEQLLSRDAENLYNLRAAGRLQRRVLLPHAPPDWPELRWATHYAPLDHLGGDYYDFAFPDPDHLGFLIADASGHSIPAALVAILARYAFVETAGHERSPGAVLSTMNARLQDLAEERFVTAFYGVYDRRTGLFRYANAGHPHPLLFEARTGRVRPLAARGFMLGIIPDEVYDEREVELEPGDRITFLTDGLIEARNGIGELFGNDRLTECLREHGRRPAAEVLREVLAAQRAFSDGAKLTDDLTVAVADVVAE